MRNICDFEVGDYELREAIFSINNLTLRFRNMLRSRQFSIDFSKVQYVTLESNLTQNIIGRIIEIAPQEFQSVEFVRRRLIELSPTQINFDIYKCIYIEPIAGAEVIVVCEKYSIDLHL
jgi:hypothetical protein